jgi:hypothetical protein
MNIIRVDYVQEFKGENVVLLAMDASGLEVFLAALIQTQHATAVVSTITNTQSVSVIEIGGSAARIDVQNNRVMWSLPKATLTEMIEKLQAMRTSPTPCHHYVNMDSPAKTLVLSRDEYV